MVATLSDKKKVAIVGSRTFTDYTLLETILDKYKDKINVIVSGGAVGADSLGAKWATKNGIKTTIFKPDWNTYGKKAGYMRNMQIIEECDICIAFWDGESKGTKHSIGLCQQINKPYKVVRFPIKNNCD